MKKYFLFLIVALMATVSSTSCSDDDDNPLDDKTMLAGTTENIGNAAWRSSNKYIASVENGILTANRVGTASISSDEGSFNVKVTPKYHLYEQPVVDWDATPSKISSIMESKGYELFSYDNGDLCFYGKDDEAYIGYIFNKDKLYTSFVLLTYAQKDKLGDFLDERYVYLGTSGQSLSYLTVDSKSIVNLGVTTFLGNVYYNVTYIENTTGGGLDDIFNAQNHIYSFLSKHK